ncbi:MAG: hypothetical protein KTR16_08930 [Acidiferrobacterales bacterium]|nr:hypothetical protein [Acidiferrobacterales bacterium]
MRWLLPFVFLFLNAFNTTSLAESGITACSEPFEFNGALYFCGTHPELGKQILKVKAGGSRKSAKVLKEIWPANAATLVRVTFFVLKDELYFLSYAEPRSLFSNQLWKTDGTEKGTVLIKDKLPTIVEAFRNFQPLITDSVAYFNEYEFDLNTGEERRSVWRTNGTTQGTLKLNLYGMTDGQGSDFGTKMLVGFGGAMYYEERLFSDDETLEEVRIMKIDDNDLEPTLLLSFNDCTSVSGIFGQADHKKGVLNERFLFEAVCSDKDNPTRESIKRLYSSDGTSSSAQVLTTSDDGWQRVGVTDKKIVLQNLKDGSIVLTDGLDAKKIEVCDANQVCGPSSSPLDFEESVLDNLVFFNFELGFRDIGTDRFPAIGVVNLETEEISEVNSGTFKDAKTITDKKIFIRDLTPQFDLDQLYVFDSNDVSNSEIIALFVVDTVLSSVVVSNRYYFLLKKAVNGVDQIELWESDATTQGTKKVTTISEGRFGEVTRLGEKMIIQVNQKLWISDGTLTGTFPLAFFEPLTLPPIFDLLLD